LAQSKFKTLSTFSVITYSLPLAFYITIAAITNNGEMDSWTVTIIWVVFFLTGISQQAHSWGIKLYRLAVRCGWGRGDRNKLLKWTRVETVEENEEGEVEPKAPVFGLQVSER